MVQIGLISIFGIMQMCLTEIGLFLSQFIRKLRLGQFILFQDGIK